MARIRTIKPEFWTDEKLVEEEPWIRLLFIGLWNFADDEGFLPYSPKRIKMQVFPADSLEVSRGLQRLISIGALTLYDSEKGQVLQVTNWGRHQKVSNPSKSKYADLDLEIADPEPLDSAVQPTDFTEPSMRSTEPSRVLSPEKEKEGKGKGREGYSPHAVSPPAASPKIQAHRIVNTWLDGLENRPPTKSINDALSQITLMVQDGIEEKHMLAGLEDWWEGNYPASTIPNYVRVHVRGTPGRATAAPPPRRATGEDRALDILAITGPEPEDPEYLETLPSWENVR